MAGGAPEKALALSRLGDSPVLYGYTRLYFGAEFCSWAMPAPAEIFRARETARRNGLNFTLMTPVLREETLADLAGLLRTLAPEWQEQDELLISDFGTLEIASAELPRAQIILGRALSGQKRGPRIESLELTESAASYFRQGRWYPEASRQLLADVGIFRVELDNLLQGLDPLPGGLCGSLHFPWLLVTSSRNCPYHADKSGQRCGVGCGEAMQLSTPQTRHDLFQAGNSQFIENRSLPEDLAGLGIDRIVEHPKLPR